MTTPSIHPLVKALMCTFTDEKVNQAIEAAFLLGYEQGAIDALEKVKASITDSPDQFAD